MMILVFVSYVVFIWSRYGIQKSISASYYVLPEKINVLFTLFCWGFAFPAIIVAQTPLMFLAGSAIVFVGAAARFKEKLTKSVHMISATIGVILSQASIFFDYHLWHLNAIFVLSSLIILGVLYFKHIDKYIWWIEIFAFSTICIALGINSIF